MSGFRIDGPCVNIPLVTGGFSSQGISSVEPCLSHCCPFVWRDHWLSVGSPRRRSVVRNFIYFGFILPICDVEPTIRVASQAKSQDAHRWSLLCIICLSVMLKTHK